MRFVRRSSRASTTTRPGCVLSEALISEESHLLRVALCVASSVALCGIPSRGVSGSVQGVSVVSLTFTLGCAEAGRA